MAILRAYGWESGQLMVPDARTSGTVTISSADPKTGTYCVYMANYANVKIPVDGTVLNPSLSVWIDPSSAYTLAGTANTRLRVAFELDSGALIELRWNGTSKTFDAFVDGSEVASGTVEVSNNEWFHLQFYVVIDDAPNGQINVKINGHESIAYTGDTKPASETDTSYARLYNTVNNPGFYMDDLVVGNAGYLGDLRCVDIRPNADTAVDDWTPSAGDNYSTIDESSTSEATIDGDYNETSTDAHADELDMTDFDGTTYIPVAVTAWVRARQDAGVGDSIYVGVDSGGTDDVSAAQGLENDWDYYFHTLDDNPADAAEWEDADIDALKLRYESDIP